MTYQANQTVWKFNGRRHDIDGLIPAGETLTEIEADARHWESIYWSGLAREMRARVRAFLDADGNPPPMYPTGRPNIFKGMRAGTLNDGYHSRTRSG